MNKAGRWRQTRYRLFLVVLAALLNPTKLHADPAPAALRLMTLNIAHGRGQAFNQLFVRKGKLKKNLLLIGELIRRTQADIVAFQEIDRRSSWSRHIDQLQWLASQGGFTATLMGNHSHGKFGIHAGTAIMAKYPLLESASNDFNASWRDNKGFVFARIDAKNHHFISKIITVMSVHLDFLNSSVRKKQIAQIIQYNQLNKYSKIIMGDFNCEWSANDCVRQVATTLLLKTYQPKTKLSSYPAKAPTKRLDWILVSTDLQIRRYEILRDKVSDHLPVYMEIDW